MKKPIDQPTLEEAVMVRALEMEPCPDCHWVEGYFVEKALPPYDVQGVLCRTCHGTGQVPRFTMLRVEQQGIWSHRDCPSMHHCQNLLADDTAPRGITDCKGRGWVPVTTMDALLNALWSEVYYITSGNYAITV